MAKTLLQHQIAISTNGNGFDTDQIDLRGATLIVVFVGDSRDATHATISDTQSNMWLPLTPKDDTILGYLQGWYKINPATEQFQQFTVTSSAGFPIFLMQAWDMGSGLVAVLDQQAQGSSISTTSFQTGSITPTDTTDLMIAAAQAIFATGGFSVDGSFTVSDSDGNEGNNLGGAMTYRDGGSGSFNPTISFSGTSPASGITVCFRAVDPTGVGSAASTSTATAVGMASVPAVGSASETSTATAVGRSEPTATGTAAATSTASAVGRSASAAVGSAAATSVVFGSASGFSYIVGSCACTSTAFAFSVIIRDFSPTVKQLIPLVEVEFDSETLRWAMDGSDTPDGFYSKRIQSIGSIDREVPRLCGLLTVGSISFVCFNTDQYMSSLRKREAWRGRRARVLFGDAFGSFDEFVEVYVGSIADWDFENDLCTITVEDDSIDRFSVPVTKFLRRLTAGGYPDATPANTQPYLIPFVMGTIQPPDGGSNGGQLPAYMINASTFVYVACHEALITIDQVYVYGVLKLLTVDYSVSTFVASGGETFTVITFVSDPRDLINHTIDEVEVTWCGHTSEDNPITLMKYFLTTRAGVLAAEFADSWQDIIDEFTLRAYRGSLVITKADYTIADVIARFCRTWGIRMFLTRDGKWGIDFIGVLKTPVLALTEKDVLNFRQSSYQAESYAARVHFNYDYNFAKPNNEYFRHTPDLISAAEALNLSSDIPFNLNQWYARTIDGSASTPISLATFFLALMRESGIIVRCEIDIKHFNAIDIGDVFSLSHWEGIAESGGFVEKPIIVLHIQMVPSPESSQLVITGYVDPEQVQASPQLSANFEFDGGLVVEDVTAS